MNQTPFEDIYNLYYNDVWKFLLHASADVHVALELTSQTFFRAFRAWPRFKNEAPVKSWLIQIAVNEWRRELRRRSIRRVLPMFLMPQSGESVVEFDHAEAESISSDLERNESYLSLQRALLRLPEKYMTPIMLRYFEYMSMEEVAVILGRPVGTVKSLVHRGIAKLREDQGLREACGESILEASQLTTES
jgi:RNA polymerase sigma-70 factor, ECF subfamily